MNKLLIEVTLPAAELTYDLFVPDTMQVGVLTQLVSSVFAELSDGQYTAGHGVLCEQETGCQYDAQARLFETNIRNGTGLLLF